MEVKTAMAILHRHRDRLTRQQIKTLRGQILHGDADGAIKGLVWMMRRENELGKH